MIHIYSKNSFIKELLEQKYKDYTIASHDSPLFPQIDFSYARNIVIINYSEEFSNIVDYLHQFSSLAHIIFLTSISQDLEFLQGKRVSIMRTPISYGDLFDIIDNCPKSILPISKSLILNTELRLLIKLNERCCCVKEEISLTEKEIGLIVYLLDDKESKSKEDILLKVFGYNAKATTHTLETHIYRLRQKIGDHGNLIEHSKEGYKLLV